MGYLVARVRVMDALTGKVTDEMKEIATAFAAQHTYPSNQGRRFLVTARHAVFDKGGNRRGPLWVRFEHKDTGKPELFRLPENWLTHHDSGVDLAVEPGLPAKAKVRQVQSEMWATEKLLQERQIGVGTSPDVTSRSNSGFSSRFERGELTPFLQDVPLRRSLREIWEARAPAARHPRRIKRHR